MPLVRTAVACGGALVALSLFATPDVAVARPQYLKTFAETYPDLAEAAKTAKCGVCHYGDSKKNNNDYGMAMKTGLGSENVKDPAAIKAALGKVEGEKNAEGKSFGELIKAGKLPGTNPAA